MKMQSVLIAVSLAMASVAVHAVDDPDPEMSVETVDRDGNVTGSDGGPISESPGDHVIGPSDDGDEGMGSGGDSDSDGSGRDAPDPKD